MSTVTVAWLALRTAPAGKLGLFVGLAVAAYTLPAAIGALALGRHLRHQTATTTTSIGRTVRSTCYHRTAGTQRYRTQLPTSAEAS
jgi:hypothetical protein